MAYGLSRVATAAIIIVVVFLIIAAVLGTYKAPPASTTAPTTTVTVTTTKTVTTTETITTTTTVTVATTSTTTSSQKYEVKINGIYVYIDGDTKYVIFDAKAGYHGDGTWTVWAYGFKLIANDGNVYSAVSIPLSIADRFKRELLLSTDVTRYGYTPFQIAFALPKNASPERLIYDEYGVRFEIPITPDIPTTSVSYYGRVDVKVRSAEMDCIYADSTPWFVYKSYLQGEQFNVTVTIKIYEFSYCHKVSITGMFIKGAELVRAVPSSTSIAPGGSVEITLVLRAPQYSYSGDLLIEVATQTG